MSARTRSMAALLMAISCAHLAADDKPEAEKKNPLAGQPAAIAAGRELFQSACSGCHGPHGEGARGPNLANGDKVRGLSDARLFESIRKGVPGTEMPPSNFPDEQIWQLAAFLRSLSAVAMDSPSAGNVGAGQDLFFGKARCAQCHMIRGRGGYLGPDLSNIARLRSARDLTQSIVEPNARIADGYRGVSVRTRSGQSISGVARDNTNYSMALLDAAGGLHLLSKRDLAEVVFRKGSLMPADYGKTLSSTELRDLLAFLSRQSTAEPAPEAHP